MARGCKEIIDCYVLDKNVLIDDIQALQNGSIEDGKHTLNEVNSRHELTD